MIKRRQWRALALGVAAVLLLLAGCGGRTGGLAGASGKTGAIEVSGAWARTAEQGGSTAVYGVIRNTGNAADALHDVEVPELTHEAMLHESKMVDNVMQMVHQHQIELPAGGKATLERGGLHIMLMNIGRELRPGDTIDVTLIFEHAAPLTLAVPVLDQ